MKNGRKHKKLIAVLLCLSLIAILLIGCDSSRSRKTSSSNELIENDKEDENGMNRNKHIELFDGINATIKEDGSIYIWGADDSFTDTASLKNAVSVSVGKAHIGVITQEGSLYMWGDNSCGQLGNGTTRGTLEPKKIMDNVSYVELGRYHSGAVTTDGELYMWGANSYGQLGDGTTTGTLKPKKIMDNCVQFSTSYRHTGAVTKDGSLYTWGEGTYGELGNGTKSDSLEPTKIMDDVVQVSLGFLHGSAITKDGNLYLWGDNDYGQIGDGTDTVCLSPKFIMGNVERVSLGTHHSGAITKDGELYMWGDPYKGAIGYGESNNKDTMYPLQIMTNIKFSELSLGDSYSSAVTEDGTLYMWGNNEDCRLGVDNYGKGEGNEASRSAYYAPVKLMDGIKVK